MKKICKFSFALILSFALVFLCGTIKPSKTEANAAGVVTIYFNASGGECLTTELTTSSEGKLTELPTPTKENYFFNGWYTEVEKTNKVSLDTVYDYDTILYAGWAEKNYSYTVTESSGTYTIEGHTTSADINYTLSTGLTDFSAVFAAISTEVPDKTTMVSLNLPSITLTESLTIPFSSFTLSGNLEFDTTDSAIKVNTTEHNSVVTFKNLVLSGKCKNYIDFVSTAFSTNVTFSNCDFEATTTDDYGLSISNIEYSMTFDTYFNHSSTYLYSFVQNLNVFMETELADSSKIVITSVHTLKWREVIIKKFNRANLNNFSILPLNDFYAFELVTVDAALRVNSHYATEYDLGGAEFVGGFTPVNINYRPDVAVKLPDATNIEYAHHTFKGWLATFELTDDEKTSYNLNANKYYFNKTQLENLKNANFDYTLLDTIFSTTVPETSPEEYITEYSFAFSTTDENYINFLVFNIFADFEKKPKFTAVFEDIIYSLTFVTNTDTPNITVQGCFDDEIVFPTLTKEGHTLDGWYTDEELTTPFTLTKLDDSNSTIYAKWTTNTYQITIHPNNGEAVSVLNVLYGDTITFPVVSYKGHSFVAYFEDESLTTVFESETMPSRNLDIYLKWTLKKIRIHLDSRCAAILDAIIITYGEKPTEPAAPTNPGYTFLGWYTTTSYTTRFDFDKIYENDSIAYARWLQELYSITFNSNGGSVIPSISRYFGESITSLGSPVKKNYIFDGWFTDEELTVPNEHLTMPDRNITLYAKWTEKEVIDVSINPQTFKINDLERGFVANENYSNFVIKYFVNGEWTTALPQSVGSYNVNIFRAEDDEFAEVNITIENGYVLNNKILNLLWLAITLYVLFLIEVVVVIALRKLRNKKINDFISLGVAFPFGVIPTGQFVAIITGLVLAIFGFVLIVYELVKLHRAMPNEITKPSDFDNTVNITKIVDNSEDKKIDDKVDELLKTEFAEYDYSKINSTKPQDFEDENNFENFENNEFENEKNQTDLSSVDDESQK